MTDQNPRILIIFAEDHHIKETQKTIQKTEIADQLVKVHSIEIITRDQILIEENSQTIAEIAHIQTFGIETDPMIAQETIQTTAIDHETIKTIDRKLIVITKDPMKILEIETTTIKTEQQIILNHCIGTTHNNQIDKIKATEVVNQNIKDKSIKYKL